MWDTLYFGTEPLLNRWPFKKIRDIAIQKTMEHIHYEDENSRYITIGCVEKVMPVPRIKQLNGSDKLMRNDTYGVSNTLLSN